MYDIVECDLVTDSFSNLASIWPTTITRDPLTAAPLLLPRRKSYRVTNKFPRILLDTIPLMRSPIGNVERCHLDGLIPALEEVRMGTLELDVLTSCLDIVTVAILSKDMVLLLDNTVPLPDNMVPLRATSSSRYV